jgi:Ca2+-binding RTX toxin-like protein
MLDYDAFEDFPTVAGEYFDKSDLVPVSITGDEVVFEVMIEFGPMAGQELRVVFSGAFDTDGDHLTGSVASATGTVGGVQVLEKTFDEPVEIGAVDEEEDDEDDGGDTADSHDDDKEEDEEEDDGDDGDDDLSGGDGDDELSGGGGDDDLHGKAGHDRLFGDDGDDLIIGGTGRDQLHGGKGHDELKGGGGEDVLRGGRGGDELHGGRGDDRLFGGKGADILDGGSGRDVMTGAGGRDTFVFADLDDTGTDGLRDKIKQFKAGRDMIDVSGIDARDGLKGDQGFEFIGNDEFSGEGGEVRYKKGLLQADINGDGLADFEIDMRGAHGLDEGDFLL